MKRVILYIQRVLIGKKQKKLFVVVDSFESIILDDIKLRLNFYVPELTENLFCKVESVPWIRLIAGDYVMNFKIGVFTDHILSIFSNSYAVDHRRHVSGWEWVRFVNDYYDYKVDTDLAMSNLRKRVEMLMPLGYNKSYIFGTGPSLARASSLQWDDGYRIVCNTIVRDLDLFFHISPHFVVAGDAVYHFSHTKFAVEFRKDLLICLQEFGTYFVYPDQFDVMVQREFSSVRNQLVPVPVGGHSRVNVNLLIDFRLPALGNVLPLLLIPLACTLSSRIYMWGFDGRAPTDYDSKFWQNSNKQSYPEFMYTLNEAFPYFFEYYVPNNNSNSYIQNFHGHILDNKLSIAESEGYLFVMMHPSWTKTLQSRFCDDVNK